MKKSYIIYCDESVKDGCYYSNFYGGALIEEKHREFIEEKLQQVKDKQNIFNGELKWTKITENYEEKYKAFIETYFNLMKEGYIKTRIMFSHTPLEPIPIKGEAYFKLYYQFLKHAFGFRYHPFAKEIVISLMLDKIPHNKEAFDQFKNYMNQLENIREFQNIPITFRKENIVDIDSKKHVILQALDINLGAMSFRLNDLHKVIPTSKKRRGKRTIAKERVYKFIHQKICEIRPNFNIGISTGKDSNVSNRWRHPYRHWKFIPKDSTNKIRTK